jgi:hypothetical protein
LGPTGDSGGRCWETVSKNSSGMQALARVVGSLREEGYRVLAQN